MTPLIVTAALVGAEVTREETPHLPITALEIGREARLCREAGAAMVHLHVREADGRPSQSAALFGAAVREVRRQCDILIQLSTGGAVGMGVDERCGGLTLQGDLRPDMATLTTGSVNFGDAIFENPRPLIRDIARRIRASGAVPEIECFDAGMIDEALALAREGLIDLPAHFDFVLGVPGALGASPEALRFLASKLPAGCSWSVAAMGRHELPFAELAIELGGHARVGLEDNIYIEKGVLAKGSCELVARVAELAKRHGRPLATPAEARALLRLPPR